MILNIAKGCFTSKENIVGNLFTTFIANKLDKPIAPKDMLFEPWDTVKTKIKSCVYDSNGYRPDIASDGLQDYLIIVFYISEKRGPKQK